MTRAARDVGREDGVVNELATALGRRVPAAERRAWLAMSVGQRARALDRIALLDRWNRRREDLTLERASDSLGVKPKRFYELASAWQADRSLKSLGSFADAPPRASRLDGRAVNILQKLLPGIVRSGGDLSVEQLRLQLIAAARTEIERTGPHGKEVILPSRMVARRMIERERERLVTEAMIGVHLHLDFCAVSLFGVDGRPFVVFALLDRSSRLVVGHAIADPAEPVSGYAAAAAAALASLSITGAMGTWSAATTQVEVVADAGGLVPTTLGRMGEVVPRIDVQFTRPGSNGRYLRRAVGDWLGRAQLRGGLTNAAAIGTALLPEERHSRDEAAIEIARAVATHNAGLGLRRRRGGRPPDNLVALLRVLDAAAA